MPRARKTPATDTNHALLAAILELVPSLFFKLKVQTEALHVREGLTTGERGVLRENACRDRRAVAGAVTVHHLLRPVRVLVEVEDGLTPGVDGHLEDEQMYDAVDDADFQLYV